MIGLFLKLSDALCFISKNGPFLSNNYRFNPEYYLILITKSNNTNSCTYQTSFVEQPPRENILKIQILYLGHIFISFAKTGEIKRQKKCVMKKVISNSNALQNVIIRQKRGEKWITGQNENIYQLISLSLSLSLSPSHRKWMCI